MMRLPDPMRSRVILLGSSEYEDKEHLPAIPSVQKTIRDLEAALTDPKHGIVPPERCTVLLDERNQLKIGRTLHSVMAEVDDLLLVYFLGHGIVDTRHRLHLGLYHSDWGNPGLRGPRTATFPHQHEPAQVGHVRPSKVAERGPLSALSYDQLRYEILDAPAATKVVILDCCFSGRAIGEPMADDVAAVVGQLDVDGTYVLTSAQRDQVALVLPNEQYTAFRGPRTATFPHQHEPAQVGHVRPSKVAERGPLTGRLLGLLRDGVPGGPELLTMEDLYRHLLRMMKREGLSIPQKRGIKTADLIAISRNRVFTPNATEVLRKRYATAMELYRRGQWAAAMTELHEVYIQRARVLGDHHEDTLRTGQFLAQATGATGNPVEAAQSLSGILAEQTKRLGSDHEDTLRSRQFLALNLGESGRRGEALAMLRVLLADQRRVLGAEHDAVMRTQHVLARYLAMSGVFDEAVALFKEVLSVRSRLLGADHEATEHTRRDLEDVERRRQDPGAVSDGRSLTEAESVV